MSAEGKALVQLLRSGRLAERDPDLAAALHAKIAELFGSSALWLRREGHDGVALLTLLPLLRELAPNAADVIERSLAIAWAGAKEAVAPGDGSADPVGPAARPQ